MDHKFRFVNFALKNVSDHTVSDDENVSQQLKTEKHRISISVAFTKYFSD